MTIYRLGLEFKGGDGRRGLLPFAAARIYLKTWTTGDDDEEMIYVGADCTGPVELAGQVEMLKKELDEILATGRRKFAQGRSRAVTPP